MPFSSEKWTNLKLKFIKRNNRNYKKKWQETSRSFFSLNLNYLGGRAHMAWCPCGYPTWENYFFYHVGPGDQTWVIRLGYKHQLSHIASPCPISYYVSHILIKALYQHLLLCSVFLRQVSLCM